MQNTKTENTQDTKIIQKQNIQSAQNIRKNGT